MISFYLSIEKILEDTEKVVIANQIPPTPSPTLKLFIIMDRDHPVNILAPNQSRPGSLRQAVYYHVLNSVNILAFSCLLVKDVRFMLRY